MKASKARLFAFAAVAVAAGVALAANAYVRNGATQRTFEGWIEAYFIFVSPDESGRVETLSVREGDPIRQLGSCSRGWPSGKSALKHQRWARAHLPCSSLSR